MDMHLCFRAPSLRSGSRNENNDPCIINAIARRRPYICQPIPPKRGRRRKPYDIPGFLLARVEVYYRNGLYPWGRAPGFSRPVTYRTGKATGGIPPLGNISDKKEMGAELYRRKPTTFSEMSRDVDDGSVSLGLSERAGWYSGGRVGKRYS